MSNSPLVTRTKLSPNHSGIRTHGVDRITPHCFVGQVTVDQGLNTFASPIKKASCNYVIGKNGEVGLCVNENCRSWCSSSNDNDQRAITIECASDNKNPYQLNDIVYAKLVDLCIDICKRYNKTKLIWIEDKSKALSYEPKDNEMLITVHRWFANKSCPGEWLYNRLGSLADTVTSTLNNNVQKEKLYCVQVGAYKVKANATTQKQKLEKKGYRAFVTQNNNYFRVQIGSFKDKKNATKLLEKVKTDGFTAYVTTKEV